MVRMATMAMAVVAVLVAVAAADNLTIYTKANAPAAPKVDDLPQKESVSQYGITWTFSKPARVGQFITGDYYVVGPVTITGITPEPKDGRNGSCLNPNGKGAVVGFDDRIVHGRYDAKLFLAPPIEMKPGDSLVSAISVDRIGPTPKMLWKGESTSPVKTAAVLTCLSEPVPADAFRPSYVGGWKTIRLARDLHRELLPDLEPIAKMPTLAEYERVFQRPWIDLAMDEFCAPLENLPQYGREFVRAAGTATLLLCMDYKPEQKERLLVSFVQVGIDLWGLAPQPPESWNALGGHGNGRKWPILFAGMMFDDAAMMAPEKTYPGLAFSEDKQTMFGPSWTGAKAVWAGHVGKDGSPRHPGWGAYEHLPPSKWENNTGESYRRCCTSNAWVNEALAARILHAEGIWNHDAFFAYTDRWMTENDAEFVKQIKEERGWDYDKDWSRQETTWDPYVKDLWKKYRNNLPPAKDGSKTPPDTATWK